MEIDKTRQLTASVSPSDADNKTVTWSAEPSDIASVSSSGLVNALKEGTAVITATTIDGGKRGSATVTVTKKASSQPPLEEEFLSITGATYMDEEFPTFTVEQSFEEIVVEGTSVSIVSPVELNTIFVGVEGVEGYLEVDAATALLTRAVFEYSFEVDLQEDLEESFMMIVSASTSSGDIVSPSNVRTDKENVPESVRVEGAYMKPTELTMRVDETKDLTGKTIPDNAYNKSVRFQSSDPSVVTVDYKGKVLAVGPGVATVKVITEEGGFEATCVITVGIANPVSVEDVVVSPSSVELIVGDSRSLTATVLPERATNKAVAWSSSNESVATVSASGVVTAIAAGQTVITATTADGNKTDTCNVTVNEYVPVTDIILEQTVYEYTPHIPGVIEGSFPRLIAKVLPENATDKNIVWSFAEGVLIVDRELFGISETGEITRIPDALTVSDFPKILATADNGKFTKEFEITVNQYFPVIDIDVSPTKISDDQYALRAYVTYSTYENRENLIWTRPDSADNDYQFVDSSGTVLSQGTGSSVSIKITDLTSSFNTSVIVSTTDGRYSEKIHFTIEVD